MGSKGDRAAKAPLAERLYVDGHSLAEISRQLDVSDTTLRRWKSDSGIPGEEVDGWDRARQQKRGNIQRLKDLFERQLEYVEGLNPDEVTAPMMDTLSKLGALVERADRMEEVIRRKAIEDAAATVEETAKQSGVSEDTIKAIRRDVLRMAE
jgi:transposase-like protein